MTMKWPVGGGMFSSKNSVDILLLLVISCRFEHVVVLGAEPTDPSGAG